APTPGGDLSTAPTPPATPASTPESMAPPPTLGPITVTPAPTAGTTTAPLPPVPPATVTVTTAPPVASIPVEHALDNLRAIIDNASEDDIAAHVALDLHQKIENDIARP